MVEIIKKTEKYRCWMIDVDVDGRVEGEKEEGPSS